MKDTIRQLLEKARASMAENDPHKNDEPGAPWHRDFVSKEAASVQSFSVAECQSLCKKAGVEYLSGYENRIVQFKYTDGTIDRYGDKILAKGVKLDKYKANPVILGFHDSHTFPIGTSLKVWYEKSDDSVKGWVLFLDDRVDSTGFADSMFRMVKAGVVKCGSIGFIPIKFRRPDEDERKELGIGEYGYLFEEVELIEFSIVPLPANPAAMMEPVTKGLITKRAIDTIEEKKIFSAEDISQLRSAQSIFERNQVSPKAETTIGNAAEVKILQPEAPFIEKPINTKSSISFTIIGTMKEIPELLKMVDSYRENHDVNVEISVKEESHSTELAEVCQIMRDIKTKTLLNKEQKNVIQDCMTHVTALMECLQELLDASSVDDSEEGTEDGKSVNGNPEVSPVGDKSDKTIDMYSPDFLRKIDEKTNEVRNIGKGK